MTFPKRPQYRPDLQSGGRPQQTLRSTALGLMKEAAAALAAGQLEIALARAEVALTLDRQNSEARRVHARARSELTRMALASDPATGDRRVSALRVEVERIVRVADRVSELAPFPSVLATLTDVLNDETASAHDTAAVLSTDPALSARVLRLANAAARGRIHEATTIRQAVVELGNREVGNLAIATAVVDRFPEAQVVDIAAFWRFSLVVGLVAELVARTRGSNVEEAFTAGVIHRIGLLALDLAEPDGLRQVLADGESGRLRRLHDRERAVFGFTDAELGAELARRWLLPEPLVRAVASHGARFDEVDEEDLLSRAVIDARILARFSGLHDGVEQSPVRELPPAWTVPPLSIWLARAGGVEGILKRVDSLLVASAA